MAFELLKVNYDSKKTWSKLKEWNIHGSKVKQDIPDQFHDVNIISDHFESVGRVPFGIDMETLDYYKNNTLLAVENQFTFARITEYDVYRAFGLIKAKGSGYDGLS